MDFYNPGLVGLWNLGPPVSNAKQVYNNQKQYQPDNWLAKLSGEAHRKKPHKTSNTFKNTFASGSYKNPQMI